VTRPLAQLRPIPSTQRSDAIDLDAAERAAHDLLSALGVDLAGESLRETPRRIARMYAELLTPAPLNVPQRRRL
jgi:GTP cyclohydrolase IA